MQGPTGLQGELLEDIMARLRSAGVLKDDEPGYPAHYNRAYSAVLEALQLNGISDTPRGALPQSGVVDIHVPYFLMQATKASVSMGQRVSVDNPRKLSDALVSLAKQQGRSLVPGAWPRLKPQELCMVTASDGTRYAMQVWKMNGKQITFLSQGKLEADGSDQ